MILTHLVRAQTTNPSTTATSVVAMRSVLRRKRHGTEDTQGAVAKMTNRRVGNQMRICTNRLAGSVSPLLYQCANGEIGARH
jgi:hypothetical protein